METITLNKKKYVVVEQSLFENLQKVASSKQVAQKKLSLKEGKKMAYNLIDKWAKGK